MGTEFLIPAGDASAEFTEKRSHFIGDIFYVESEEEARARLEEVRKRHHDARHHCWCYRIQEPSLERYSDDGEPQGTAGQPMLSVFSHEGVTNVLCVVTRYFGGILLGTGGLARAYTQGAKSALEAAGIAVKRLWKHADIRCEYSLFERIKLLVGAHEGIVADVEYGADVVVHALFPSGKLGDFSAALTELSNGTLHAAEGAEEFRAFPLER